MERQVHHLNRLVDDLLEVSRITRGIIEVKKEPLDLSAIVKAAVETSRPVLDNLRHELIVDLDRRADLRRRRPGAADAGVREPAEQRREVHRTTAAASPSTTRQRAAARPSSASRTTASASRPTRWRRCSTCSCRSIDRRGDAGRARHRPDAGAQPRRHARRHGRGAQRRPRARQRIHRPAAAAGRTQAASRASRAASSRCRRAAS